MGGFAHQVMFSKKNSTPFENAQSRPNTNRVMNVVTANTTSLPEIVGDAAVTVDPNDPDGIAGALEMVASGSESRVASA